MPALRDARAPTPSPPDVPPHPPPPHHTHAHTHAHTHTHTHTRNHAHTHTHATTHTRTDAHRRSRGQCNRTGTYKYIRLLLFCAKAVDAQPGFAFVATATCAVLQRTAEQRALRRPLRQSRAPRTLRCSAAAALPRACAVCAPALFARLRCGRSPPVGPAEVRGYGGARGEEEQRALMPFRCTPVRFVPQWLVCPGTMLRGERCRLHGKVRVACRIAARRVV